MPLFAALVKALFGNLTALYLAIVSTRLGLVVAAAAALGGLYVTAVGVFTAFVQPLIASAFSTAYGQVLGLAFPPVAGTVVAGLAGLWVALITKSYLSRVLSVLAPKA